MKFNPLLYLVTDRDIAAGRDLVELVEAAVRGGVTVVQLREKECPTGEFIELAKRLKEVLHSYDVPLIINDRVDVALAADADGVHIGQSDMPYSIAREILGDDKIIGLSVETIEEVAQAESLDVDYIALSPIFSTSTKLDIKSPFELEGAARARELSGHPMVAIGGINCDNCREITSIGIDGVAVISAILGAKDPEAAAKEFRERLTNK